MMILLRRCSYLLMGFVLSCQVSFAQKGTDHSCARAVTDMDTFVSQMNWVDAQATMQQMLEGKPDVSCKRKLLALFQRMGYAQGQYRNTADYWKGDAPLFQALIQNASIPYPESIGFLFAGLNNIRSGRWKEGGMLTTIGVKNTSYNMLRLMKLEDVDIHYIIAGLGAGMDTMPATAAPLIPMIMGKWESGGNHLTVQADSNGVNYYLGRVLVEYRHWADAIPFLQKELGKSTPHVRATEYLLGKCYNELGQYDKAVALLRPLFDNDKSDWVTLELERAMNGADHMKK